MAGDPAGDRDILDRVLVSMRRLTRTGLEPDVRVREAGYADQNRRSRRWMDEHASDLVD